MPTPTKLSGPNSWKPANVTLYGNEVFADVIKDFKVGRLSWIFQVGPHTHKCPYRRKAEGDLTHREEKAMCEDIAERDLTLKIGIMLPQPRNDDIHQKFARGKKWILHKSIQRECGPADNFDHSLVTNFRPLSSRTMRE